MCPGSGIRNVIERKNGVRQGCYLEFVLDKLLIKNTSVGPHGAIPADR